MPVRAARRARTRAVGRGPGMAFCAGTGCEPGCRGENRCQPCQADERVHKTISGTCMQSQRLGAGTASDVGASEDAASPVLLYSSREYSPVFFRSLVARFLTRSKCTLRPVGRRQG